MPRGKLEDLVQLQRGVAALSGGGEFGMENAVEAFMLGPALAFCEVNAGIVAAVRPLVFPGPRTLFSPEVAIFEQVLVVLGFDFV